MNPLGLLKPEYVFRPCNGLQRIFGIHAHKLGHEFVDVVLPWKMPLRVRTADAIGRSIVLLGVLDLAVTETLWRLVDPGEVAADVGAHIGHMTAVLAARVGPTGTVWAFEAHPGVFEELNQNVARWSGRSFHIMNVAVSRARGVVKLEMPGEFKANRGIARVITREDPSDERSTIDVEARTLDELYAGSAPPSVLKLDVEGHELAALEGAAHLLGTRNVRDCIFEEHREYPTEVTALLEAKGYTLFRIVRRFFGVQLRAARLGGARSSWEPTSFLATLAPERACERLRKIGWQALARC